MPSRVERLTIRWLLRVTLLGTISFAVWSSIPAWTFPQKPSVERPGSGLQGAAGGPIQDVQTPVAPVTEKERGNALVVVRLKSENTDWLEGLLEGWERNIYVVDDEALKEGARLSIPKNKGREGMAYLSFIIDNYNDLPNATVFMHSQRYQWHNDDPLYDGIPMLQNLRVEHIHNEGYVSLRCCWSLGCPAEIQPGRIGGPDRTETFYTEAFKTLFPNDIAPEVVGAPCCAQFAASKAQILWRPLRDYVRYRMWLLETPLEDYISGRIMEYSWHMIFGKPAVHCPPAQECYCNTYGLCNLTCTVDACEGRYTLPPYSTMPEGWPKKGWNGEDRE